jgi:hypothetical protein
MVAPGEQIDPRFLGLQRDNFQVMPREAAHSD